MRGDEMDRRGRTREVLTVSNDELKQQQQAFCRLFQGVPEMGALNPVTGAKVDGQRGVIQSIAAKTFRAGATTDGGNINVAHAMPVGPGLWMMLRHTVMGATTVYVACDDEVSVGRLTGAPQARIDLTKPVVSEALTTELNEVGIQDRDPHDNSAADFPDFDVTLFRGDDLGTYLFPTAPPVSEGTWCFGVAFFGVNARTLEGTKAEYNKTVALLKNEDAHYDPPPFELVYDRLFHFDKQLLTCGTVTKVTDRLASFDMNFFPGSCCSPVSYEGAPASTFFALQLSGRSAGGTSRWNTGYLVTHPCMKRLYKEYIIPSFRAKGGVPEELRWLDK